MMKKFVKWIRRVGVDRGKERAREREISGERE